MHDCIILKLCSAAILRILSSEKQQIRILKYDITNRDVKSSLRRVKQLLHTLELEVRVSDAEFQGDHACDWEGDIVLQYPCIIDVDQGFSFSCVKVTVVLIYFSRQTGFPTPGLFLSMA